MVNPRIRIIKLFEVPEKSHATLVVELVNVTPEVVSEKTASTSPLRLTVAVLAPLP
ncbi:hypothetical protein D3C75_660270 [compost metagenome]